MGGRPGGARDGEWARGETVETAEGQIPGEQLRHRSRRLKGENIYIYIEINIYIYVKASVAKGRASPSVTL